MANGAAIRAEDQDTLSSHTPALTINWTAGRCSAPLWGEPTPKLPARVSHGSASVQGDWSWHLRNTGVGVKLLEPREVTGGMRTAGETPGLGGPGPKGVEWLTWPSHLRPAAAGQVFSGLQPS